MNTTTGDAPIITGLVLTFQGERLLRRCLSSLDFCDRILVVDSRSTDRTVDIARELGADVLVRPWPGPVDQFHYALEQIPEGWIISLDQDEYLSDELRASILEALRPGGSPTGGPSTGGTSTGGQPMVNTIAGEPNADGMVPDNPTTGRSCAPVPTQDTPPILANANKDHPDPDALAGYWVSRRSFYFNRFMKHSGWYPDRLLRVFRAGRMEVSASGAHYHFSPKGPTTRLRGDIVHYPYRSFREHLDKINSYAQQAADEMRAKGRKGGLLKAIAHAKLRFFKLYILKLGLLDGRAGLINALAGAYYAFQKYIRVEEKGDWGE